MILFARDVKLYAALSLTRIGRRLSVANARLLVHGRAERPKRGWQRSLSAGRRPRPACPAASAQAPRSLHGPIGRFFPYAISDITFGR